MPLSDLPKPSIPPNQNGMPVVPQKIKAWQPIWNSVNEAPQVPIAQPPISEEENKIKEEQIKLYMEWMKSQKEIKPIQV